MNLSVTGCYVNLGGNYHGVIILLSIYFEWLRSNAIPMHFFSTMCDYCFWTNQISLYIFQLKPLFSWCFGLQLTKAVFSLLKHTLNTGEFQRRKYAGNQTVWRRWLQWQTLIKIRAILTQPEDDATKVATRCRFSQPRLPRILCWCQKQRSFHTTNIQQSTQ